ncbi:hypothetical protein GALMADRAFT_206809 [Galerina marginata CBS 339.88]|uniref:Uncharacterized protein n=1 Tax=Galerina marginata (strain CBS 339.88) TaxID=685588 RepID=A0A067TVZ7_GALM3|nr:hypothetical protein GALMADRAFT_206809 [Galerina marginata CBS 339.88]
MAHSSYYQANDSSGSYKGRAPQNSLFDIAQYNDARSSAALLASENEAYFELFQNNLQLKAELGAKTCSSGQLARRNPSSHTNTKRKATDQDTHPEKSKPQPPKKQKPPPSGPNGHSTNPLRKSRPPPKPLILSGLRNTDFSISSSSAAVRLAQPTMPTIDAPFELTPPIRLNIARSSLRGPISPPNMPAPTLRHLTLRVGLHHPRRRLQSGPRTSLTAGNDERTVAPMWQTRGAKNAGILNLLLLNIKTHSITVAEFKEVYDALDKA